MFFQKHRAAVILGVVMGVTAPILAMIPSSSHSEAAVAVMDQRNIEQAIRQAIQTANILTTEQKQMALMILNAKKFDPLKIALTMNHLNSVQDAVWAEIGYNKEAEQALKVWMSQINDIKRVGRGEMTVYDVINKEVKRQEAMAKQADTAAKQAQKLEDRSANRLIAIQDVVDASNNAEGSDQILQAGNHLAAIDAQNSIDANVAAANYYQAKIADMQAENARRATAAAKDVQSANAMYSTLNSMVRNGDVSGSFARSLQNFDDDD